jgi:hypothetical protein
LQPDSGYNIRGRAAGEVMKQHATIVANGDA